MKYIHIKNAHIADPASFTNKKADFWIIDDKIYRSKPDIKQRFQEIDLFGKTVLPGLVDLRCHVRNAIGGDTENIKSISAVAHRGGYTTILTMPDISPYADNPGAIRYIKECAERDTCINFLIAGSLTNQSKGKSLSPIGSLKAAGITAISDCPSSTQNNEIFVKGVEYASMFDLPVIEFPREMSLSKNGSAHDGVIGLAMGLESYPRMAEELFVQRAITVAKNLNASIHLSSISSKGSVELIREAKNKEIKITADVTPHHLCLTDFCTKEYDANFKTHPPLREEDDRAALIDGLLDGSIDSICSGHEPHQEHLKNAEYDLAPAGVTSLDSCLAAVYSELRNNKSHRMEKDKLVYKLAEWLSFNPSKIITSHAVGLTDGSSADFVVVDFDQEWTYSVENSPSLSKNNPFEGKTLFSLIEKTFCAGREVYAKS